MYKKILTGFFFSVVFMNMYSQNTARTRCISYKSMMGCPFGTSCYYNEDQNICIKPDNDTGKGLVEWINALKIDGKLEYNEDIETISRRNFLLYIYDDPEVPLPRTQEIYLDCPGCKRFYYLCLNDSILIE